MNGETPRHRSEQYLEAMGTVEMLKLVMVELKMAMDTRLFFNGHCTHEHKAQDTPTCTPSASLSVLLFNYNMHVDHRAVSIKHSVVEEFSEGDAAVATQRLPRIESACVSFEPAPNETIPPTKVPLHEQSEGDPPQCKAAFVLHHSTHFALSQCAGSQRLGSHLCLSAWHASSRFF